MLDLPRYIAVYCFEAAVNDFLRLEKSTVGLEKEYRWIRERLPLDWKRVPLDWRRVPLDWRKSIVALEKSTVRLEKEYR